MKGNDNDALELARLREKNEPKNGLSNERGAADAIILQTFGKQTQKISQIQHNFVIGRRQMLAPDIYQRSQTGLEIVST